MGIFKREDRFELHLDHGKLVLVAIGGVLVGALLFLLGMVVGRNILAERPDTLARVEAVTAPAVTGAVAPLKGSDDKTVAVKSASGEAKTGAGKGSAEPEKSPETPAKAKPQYTFYENLKGPEAQEPAKQKPKPVTAKSKATLIVPKAPAGEAPVSAPVEQPRLLPERREEPKPVAAAKPAPKKSAPAKGKSTAFTVQVGSFKERAQAEKAAAQYKAKGLSTTVKSGEVKGVTWYRVHAGGFATRNEARDYLEKKLKPLGIKGFVMSR